MIGKAQPIETMADKATPIRSTANQTEDGRRPLTRNNTDQPYLTDED